MYIYTYDYIWLYIYDYTYMIFYIFIYIYICVRVTYIQMILTYLPVRIRGTISRLDCWKETNQSRMKSIFKEPQQTWLEHIYSTQKDSEKSCKDGSLIFPDFAFFYLLGLLYSWMKNTWSTSISFAGPPRLITGGFDVGSCCGLGCFTLVP